MDLILLENIGDVNEDFPIHLVIVQHFKAMLLFDMMAGSAKVFLILPNSPNPVQHTSSFPIFARHTTLNLTNAQLCALQ